MEGEIAAEGRKQAAAGTVTAQAKPILLSSSTSDDNPSKPHPSVAAVPVSDEIMRALQIVERDSVAIAESYTSLFSSLRLALSEVTSTSLENMECFNDVVGRLQESALDAATKGNRYLNSCLRLNEEMKGLESLFMQFCQKKGIEEECGLFGYSCQPTPAASMIGLLSRAFNDWFRKVNCNPRFKPRVSPSSSFFEEAFENIYTKDKA